MFDGWPFRSTMVVRRVSSQTLTLWRRGIVVRTFVYDLLTSANNEEHLRSEVNASELLENLVVSTVSS